MQETRSIHDSMNILKIEFISYIYIYYKYLIYFAMLSTFIKLQFVIKIIVLSTLSGRFTHVLLLQYYFLLSISITQGDRNWSPNMTEKLFTWT